MAEQAQTFVQDGVDRFNAARDRIDTEVQRVQKELGARRKRIEKDLDGRRKTFEKQTRKQVKQLRSDIEENWLVKQFDDLRSQAADQLEITVEAVLDTFKIASKSDVQKIDRKLSKINKRLKEMERARTTNGQQAPRGV